MKCFTKTVTSLLRLGVMCQEPREGRCPWLSCCFSHTCKDAPVTLPADMPRRLEGTRLPETVGAMESCCCSLPPSGRCSRALTGELISLFTELFRLRCRHLMSRASSCHF